MAENTTENTNSNLLDAEQVDNTFENNGIDIIDVVTLEEPQRIVLTVISDIHPDTEPIKVTMNFENDIPTTLDFEGPDIYTEEEGQAVLNSVMQSLVDLLKNVTNIGEEDTDGVN